MTISFDWLTPISMTDSVNELGTAEDLQMENFLINNVFTPASGVHMADKVAWGVTDEGIFLSGYSKKNDASTQVEKPTLKMKDLTLPVIRKHLNIDREFINELQVAVTGSQQTGPANVDPNSILGQKINDRLVRIRAMIDRQREATAAQGLATGTMTLNDVGGNEVDSVSFGYTGDGTLDGDQYTIQKTNTAGNKWTTDTGKPIDDVRKMRRQIQRFSHYSGPTMLLAGYTACDGLVNNKQTKETFHINRFELGNLSITERAQLRGFVAGIPVFEYDITWDAVGGKQSGWDPATVALIPTGGSGGGQKFFSTEFGPVCDYLNDNLDSPLQMIYRPWFSKRIRGSEDPAVQKIIVETNPLAVIWKRHAVRIKKVA